MLKSVNSKSGSVVQTATGDQSNYYSAINQTLAQ